MNVRFLVKVQGVPQQPLVIEELPYSLIPESRCMTSRPTNHLLCILTRELERTRDGTVKRENERRLMAHTVLYPT